MPELAWGFAPLAQGWVSGLLAGKALEGVARQPEAVGDIRTNMILTAALVEGVALIGEVFCLLIVLTK